MALAKMNVDKLIKEVYKRKPLWDQNNVQHHNRYVLDKKWDEVANLMKTTRDTVRMKWKCLRDNLRKELRKVSPTDSDAPESSWRYFDSLHFIHNQFSPRSQSIQDSSLVAESTMTTDSNDLEDVKDFKDVVDTTPVSNHVDDEVSLDTTAATSSRKRKRPTDSEDIRDALSRLEERQLEMLQNSVRPSQVEDDDEAFFNSLLPYVRPISHVNKLLLRVKMQKLVYEFVAEESKTFQRHTLPGGGSMITEKNPATGQYLIHI